MAVARLLAFLLIGARWLGCIAFEDVPCNATPVVCGMAFFREVYAQFRSAKSEIIIMPFFIRPKLKIFSSREGSPPDTTLEDLVLQAIGRGVHVWILGWENAASEKVIGFHQDAAFEKLFVAAGKDHEHLHLMLDSGRRLISSLYYLPHIKSYVFDRKVAFVGGMDFSENRLDTPQHIRPDARLVKKDIDENHVTGNEKPWQDVMVKVDGAAAEHVAMVLVERWWTYCKSEGYLRAQATRPLDAVTEAIMGVRHALSRSLWKKYQCSKYPEPGHLGTLDLAVQRRPGGYNISYEVEVFSPPVQSAGLKVGEAKRVKMTNAGGHVEVRVTGLRALDRKVPDWVKFNVQGTDFRAGFHSDASSQLADGDKLRARWWPNGNRGPGLPAPQTCRVVLSGDRDWMGTTTTLRESYKEHVRIIREAKRFIYIENQYFSTDFPSSSWACKHSNIRGEAVLYSGATNRIGEVLLDRIKRAGRLGEPFSVAVVTPLGTEPGSLYPNLRGAYCFEEAVEDYWKAKDLRSNWRDYFSFFFLANAVAAPPNMGGPGTAFYGVFVHTKAIIADDDVALVGSANINDRSMSGNRDAEVGVKITGDPFPREFREALLDGHLGDASRADPNRLVASMRAVAEANARALKEATGISFPEGTITQNGNTTRLLGMKDILNVHSVTPAAIPYPESRVVAGGGGVSHFKWHVVKESNEPPKLQGILFPWSRYIWGLPKITQLSQIVSGEFNWLQRTGTPGFVDDPDDGLQLPSEDRPVMLL